jgi:hypothetical protein
MFFDPRALFFLAVLIGVTGWVARGLMVTWHNLRRGKASGSDMMKDMEERLRKVEAATSGLITDMSVMREKERFMARLKASATTHEPTAAETMRTGEVSPMVRQSVPVIPRAERQR